MPEKIVVTVVYNNILFDEKLEPAWGFSCLVEGAGETILFDTGGNGNVLLSNMENLGIDPEKIDVVFLSHIHGDHTGGLGHFLTANPKVDIYLPRSFPKGLQDELARVSRKVVSVDGPVEICPGIWSTGEMGEWIKEQSMVITTRRGLVVITGCAHPGIVEIVEKAKDVTGQPVHLVTGGFHLMGYGDREMKKVIGRFRELGVQKVGPSHCTGDEQIDCFREAWGKDFINLGLGGKITVQ